MFSKGKNVGRIYGFPIQRGQWCTSDLKTKVLNRIAKGHLRADVLSHSDSEKPGETRFDKGFSGSASIEVVCEAQDIADINPTEIASHIEQGNLAEWCEGWRQVATVTVENLRLSESD